MINKVDKDNGFISLAIKTINSNAEFVIRNNNINQIEWSENTTPIAKADIEVKQTELQAEYDAQEYARNRKEEYDALNQFELISDDDVNGTTTHKDAIAAIKAKYPKPE